MTWYQSFTLLELLLCGLFVLLYGAYLLRIKRLAGLFNQKPHTIWLKFVIRHVYFALLIIAVLGPSFGAMKKEIRTSGKDIFIAVDLSASMNATDVQPSRLEKVKNELRKLVQRFNSDRIGLIIFSSEAFVQCPLTYDQNALMLYIETLDTDLVPEAGTDFAPPLQLALTKFKDEEKPLNDAKQKAQVVVLISDGEDFGDETEETLEQLVRQKIKLFTLGVGTEAGGQILKGRNLVRDEK
ncbi:MAG: VWA domain-containing protein, partial [Hymenobacteraceae bacterium]|nr:VWA domain-containing protein [Hymenobacteraceae bacterium]MDX5396580.1 VWA domain-containing protein [Hymenobacteraceae bacterium]MDX5512643.1 VWA domain-containing protein [Hymenobacteraceae bacterium]